MPSHTEQWKYLLKAARLRTRKHPVFGEVPTWGSLLESLKPALIETGVQVERHLDIRPDERGVLVVATITLRFPDGGELVTEGAAWKAWPDRPESAADPVGVALTAASRRALQFSLFASSSDFDDELPDTLDLVDHDQQTKGRPKSRQSGNADPTSESLDIYTKPRKAGENGADTAAVNELAKILSGLSAIPGRRHFMTEVKSLVGVARLEALKPEHIEAARRNLSQYAKAYEEWAKLPPDERQSLAEGDVPWVFGSDEQAAKIATLLVDE